MHAHTVLIVDSDPFLGGIYAREFASQAFGVQVAESKVQALALMQSHEFDAVIVDVDTVDGAWDLLQTKEAMRSKRVVLAQIGDKEAIQTAQKAGIETYLLKGHFVPSEICQKVLQLL